MMVMFVSLWCFVPLPSDIAASDVKALREKTGAGMMDCKKALTECKGDAEAAAEVNMRSRV